ncbi:MAG: autotransporter-associated beta strand repeat-containing protein [Luteolibacter sp.]
MKLSRRTHRRFFTRIAASAISIGALALVPCAHAINAYWMGGGADDWDGSHWDVGGSGFGTSLLNSNDESAYDLYFGSGGYHDVNGIVTTTQSVSPSSLNFSQQNWTLNVGAIASGANSASSVHLNVNNTSPQVTIHSTYGISFGTSLLPSYMDMNVDTGSVLTLNANVYGRGSLNKNGGGTAIINTPDSQASVGASGTNVFAGTLITDNPTNDYNVQGGTMNFNIRPQTWLGTRGDLTYNGNVYGPGNFVKSGSATLTMTQDIYYTGSTAVAGGRLVLATFHNPYVTSSFTFNGGDLEIRTGTSHQTYANPVNGTGSFTKSGTFNLTLTGPGNSAGGGVFVTGGSLIERFPMGQSYTLSSGSSLTFAPIGGAFRAISGAITGDGSFTMSGVGIVELEGGNTYTGGTTVTSGNLWVRHPHGNYAVASEGTLLFETSYGVQTYAGLVTGSGTFQMNGYSTLTRTADYGNGTSWTGTTIVYNGRLVELHPHGNYAMDADGTLEFANANTLFFGDGQSYASGYRSVTGAISGTGDFTKSGAGELVFTRAMTYVGRTTIAEGTLSTLVDNALPTSTDLIVNAGGAFGTSSGRSQTINSLAGDGSVVLPDSTLTIDGSTDATFSGVISETADFRGSVTKNGTGTQTLAGQNTYTGDTLVSGGTLTLADGGTLRIKVGANGVSNKLTGTGTLNLDGTLVLDLTTAGNTPGHSWTLVNTSTLAEIYGSTFALASTRGAFTKHASKWTKVENGVTYEFVPATGVLTVVPMTGYALWASSHAGGQAVDEDYNRDGVGNGIAYFLNSPGYVTLPGITGGTITWTNGGDIPHTAYGTQFKVQTSSDLVEWNDVLPTDANLHNTAGSVGYTLQTGLGRRFVRLLVTPE